MYKHRHTIHNARAQYNQLISVTATLILWVGMIPALALIHLGANLIEFSTAKDGFMWGEKDGFYVYSQSGLGDLSKVCTSIRKEQGREDEKEERLNKIYIMF